MQVMLSITGQPRMLLLDNDNLQVNLLASACYIHAALTPWLHRKYTCIILAIAEALTMTSIGILCVTSRMAK